MVLFSVLSWLGGLLSLGWLFLGCWGLVFPGCFLSGFWLLFRGAFWLVYLVFYGADICQHVKILHLTISILALFYFYAFKKLNI